MDKLIFEYELNPVVVKKENKVLLEQLKSQLDRCRTIAICSTFPIVFCLLHFQQSAGLTKHSSNYGAAAGLCLAVHFIMEIVNKKRYYKESTVIDKKLESYLKQPTECSCKASFTQDGVEVLEGDASRNISWSSVSKMIFANNIVVLVIDTGEYISVVCQNTADIYTFAQKKVKCVQLNKKIL